MPTQPPLPPLLTPYISSLSPSSLTVVSSVLGATGNWLILRYLHAALSTSSDPHVGQFTDGDAAKKRKVVLVSFLRGWEFWRSEAKRLVRYAQSYTSRGGFFFHEILALLICIYNALTTRRAWISPVSQISASSPSSTACPNFSPRQPQRPRLPPPPNLHIPLLFPPGPSSPSDHSPGPSQHEGRSPRQHGPAIRPQARPRPRRRQRREKLAQSNASTSQEPERQR
jgi:elongator complex protein 6